MSVETAVKYEKDLPQSSKEPSEGEYNQKVKELESVEATDKNHEEDLSQSSKELSKDEFYKKAIPKNRMEAVGSKDPDVKPPEINSLVGEENETLAGDVKPPEVTNLVDEEDENLAGDGKPSEVSKKLIKGSEAEEVPGVPEATQDEAHNTEHVSITGLSGDEVSKEEKAPEVPATVPDEAPNTEHDSEGHSGDDAGRRRGS